MNSEKFRKPSKTKRKNMPKFGEKFRDFFPLSLHFYPRSRLRLLSVRLVTDGLELCQTMMPRPLTFYVIYNDNIGRHVRVRWLCQSRNQRAVLFNEICKRFSIKGSRKELSTKGLVGENDLFRLVRLVPYRRELARYGGPNLISCSEDFFNTSTLWITRHYFPLELSYAEQLPIAAIMNHILLIHAYPSPKSQLELYQGSFNHNKKFIGAPLINSEPDQTIYEVWAANRLSWENCFGIAQDVALNKNQNNGPMVEWSLQCRAVIARLDDTLKRHHDSWSRQQRRFRIIGSWMHMHSNRLFVNNVDETLIAYSGMQYLVDKQH